MSNQRISKLIALLCLFVLCHSPAASAVDLKDASVFQDKQKDLELIKSVQDLGAAWLRRPELQHSLIGLEIMHIPSGKVMFASNSTRRMVPASTTKLITTACAYDEFGGEYKFKTDLLSQGEIVTGKLQGDLILVPSQDPSLTTADVRQIAQDLKKQGIKSVYGSLQIAKVPGGFDKFCSEWLVQDWGQDWMPVSSNLVLDRNVVPARGIVPGYPVSNLSFDEYRNALIKSLMISDWAPAWVEFNPANQTIYIFRPSKPTVGSFGVANPEQYNLAVIKSLLKNAGIKILGHDVEATGKQVVVVEHFSKPMSVIIHHTLKESDNLYAQQLLRLLGTLPVKDSHLQNASLEEKGLSHLTNWLYGIGSQPSDVVLYDGCGLSRKDCLTPHALNMVLKHMSAKGAFFDLLPLDADGSGQASTFRYKTGAMDSVRAITGIVRTAANEHLALTVIVNAHTPSVRELRASLKSLVDHLQALGKVPAELLKSDVENKKIIKRAKVTKSSRVQTRRTRRHRH